MLTYSQVDETTFQHSSIKNVIHDFGGKCRVARETHQDGGTHFHAFCVKDDRFITRNVRRFDVDGCHPNITPILRTPERAWAYVAKDGDIVHDDLPLPPVSRRKQKKPSKDQEVWQTAYDTAVSQTDLLNQLFKGDAARTIRSFNNVQSAAKYLHPERQYTEYTSPPGLIYEFGEYTQIPTWQQLSLGQYTTQPNYTYEKEIEAGPSEAPDSDAISTGESGSMAGSTGAETSTTGTSIDALFGEDCEFTRYGTSPSPELQMLNIAKPRARCLCIIGPTKLGKTLVARSFGLHNYFQGEWNVEQFNPDALYNVFDDIRGQLHGFHFKQFMGCQSDIDVTDKYHKKKRLKNGKPCIYLSNQDPLTTRLGREHREWLVGNCIFVYIDKPLCNIARERLEEEALESLLYQT